jgi:O-antigen/teichoic acid export membrane protein
MAWLKATPHSWECLPMTRLDKKIIFVVSTEGHVPDFVGLATRIHHSQTAKSAILSFPQNLMLGLEDCQGAAGIQEFVWNGNEVIKLSKLTKYANQLKKPSRLEKATVKLGVLSLISTLTIYAALVYRALVIGFASIIRPREYPRPSLNEVFLRRVFLESFALICGLRRFFPKPERTTWWGGIVLPIYKRLFFGLWQREVEVECLGRFFADYRPDLIVLPEQNLGYGHDVFAAVSRSSGTPILVMPYTISGQQEWAASFRHLLECRVKGFLRRLVARAFPDWVYVVDGERLIPPIAWLFSSEHLRCVPAIPWVTNSEPNGVFAVDSLFVKNFFEREGVDTSGWKIVGSLTEDRMFHARQRRDAIRKEEARRLGLNPELPFILIGLPPNQFGRGMGEGVEFGDFCSLVEFIVAAVVEVAGERFNVVVNLHPRTRREDVAFIEEGPVRISGARIEALLPAAHFYVSVASATLRWAIACEVPAINYDAYRYDYRDYQERQGVVQVKTREQFKQQVAAIAQDNTYRDRLLQAQSADAGQLFKMDGKAEARIFALMTDLCSAPRSAAAEPVAEHKTGKRSTLFRHAGAYTVANMLNSAIPLLLLPIFTRYLSPEEYGLVAMFTVLTAVVTAIAGLGTHGAVTREYFLRGREEFAGFVGTCILILAASSVALLGLIALLSTTLTSVTGIPGHWLAITVLMGAGQLLCSIGLAIWQVRGLPAIYGAFQIGVSLFNALLSLMLVIGLEMGWQGRVIGQVAAVAAMGVLATALLYHGDWIRFRFSREHARQALRYGVPLVFHAMGGTAVAMTDRTLITNLVSLDETGLYVVATQIAMVITFLAESFNRAYAPWLFEKLKEGDAAVMRRIVVGTYWYFAGILLLAGLLIAAAQPLIGFVVGPMFAGAAHYVLWLSLASAFGGMYYMVTLYIQFSGKTEQLAAVTLTVGAFNVFLCYSMIQWQGGIGAAQATAVSQLLIFLATWWMAARLIDMDWLLRRKC